MILKQFFFEYGPYNHRLGKSLVFPRGPDGELVSADAYLAFEPPTFTELQFAATSSPKFQTALRRFAEASEIESVYARSTLTDATATFLRIDHFLYGVTGSYGAEIIDQPDEVVFKSCAWRAEAGKLLQSNCRLRDVLLHMTLKHCFHQRPLVRI